MIDFAAAYYPNVEIVTHTGQGADLIYCSAARARPSAQLAEALQGALRLSDRVDTIAWNTYRHFELYFGGISIGAVLHSNPRGGWRPEHVAYIANHAEDQIIFVDLNRCRSSRRLPSRR